MSMNSSERCTILHPQYKSSSMISCLQKTRIHILVFGCRCQFRDALEKQRRALGIKHYRYASPLEFNAYHDRQVRMKDAIIAVLASQRTLRLLRSLRQNYHKLTITQLSIEYFRLISRLEAVKDSKDKPCNSIREAAVALSKMNEYFAKNDDSPTAFVATICDPRFKLAIFEHLWKDIPSFIKRAKIHFRTPSKIPRSSHETTQYRDPRYRTSRQSRTPCRRSIRRLPWPGLATPENLNEGSVMFGSTISTRKLNTNFLVGPKKLALPSNLWGQGELVKPLEVPKSLLTDTVTSAWRPKPALK
ncbi:hypothetical protein V8E54_009225 [Elaphomyces granulatus]